MPTKTPSVRAQIVARRSYNRPLDDEGTRFETWWQTIDRVIGHQRHLWQEAQGGSLTHTQEAELEELRILYLSRKSLPAGRTLWLGGTDLVKRRQASNFNCSFLEVRTVHDVVDAFWLLLQGCGVGFRPVTGSLSGFTRKMEVEVIRSERTIEDGKGRPTNEEAYDPEERIWRISVGDSAESWAKAMGKVVAGKYPARKIIFDLREIRAAGTRLKGYGWLCSGDGPLAIALAAIGTLMSKRSGKLLSKEDIWDIVNWLGTVLSSRRSAQIGMIDADDPEAKTIATRKPPGFDAPGSPLFYRSQSNNANVFHYKPSPRQVRDSFELMVDNGGSEPSFVNAVEAKRRAPWFSGLNPCGEILLANMGFCVSGDTPIITATGVGEIKDLVGHEVSIWNGRKWSRVTPTKTGEGQKLLRVYFGDGSHLDCTEYHRFSVKDRFMGTYAEVQAKDLIGFSRYTIHTEPFQIDYSGPGYTDHERRVAYTIGAIVGDWSIESNGVFLDLYGDKIYLPVLGNKSEPILKSGYNVANVAVSGLNHIADNATIKAMKDESSGLDRMFSQSKSVILSFLAGWLDTDGSNSGTGVRLYLAGHARACRVQLLLTKCGIKSAVCLHQKAGTKTNYGPRSLDSYYVHISDPKGIPCHRLDTTKGVPAKRKGKEQTIRAVVELPGIHDTYCFNEPDRHMGVFGNTLTYQCNLVENDVAGFGDDDRALHRAVYLNARANYRQTVVDLRDGILQDAWHQTNEHLRLCGVGLMGLARRPDLTHHALRQLRNTAIAGAYSMADELGLERPKNVTTVKPGGTIPKVADTTEGNGMPLGEFILNNVNFSRHDPLVPMLVDAGYRVMDHPYDATAVLITLPVAFTGVPRIGGVESAVSQLERYRMSQDAWCDQNTSNTISYDPSEIPAMVKWFDKHWDSYVGVSFMLRNDATKTAKDLGYAYLPQEVVTRDAYEAYVSGLAPVNIEDVQEDGDHEIDAGQECAGGMCPVR